MEKVRRSKRNTRRESSTELCAISSGRDQPGFRVEFINDYIGSGVFAERFFSKGSFLLEYRERSVASDHRFKHHVTSYHGPTVTLVSCEGRNLYLLASDTEWSEGRLQYGGGDCQLIQISPVYKLVQVGAGLLSWNDKSRDHPRGISVGKDSKSLPLFIPHDFDTAKHYGVDGRLHGIEVWGCGSKQAKLAQFKQKQWEKKDVERTRQQKLRLDPNWQENPDKQLLEWGGVRTSHSQR